MVFGLFSKEKALQRTIERATNKLAQQPDRWGAMEELRKNGSEDALLGLCKRWSVVAMKGSEDEQEKQWVVEQMIGLGERALPPIRRYLKSAAHLSYALKVLGEICDREDALEVADELLEDEAPGYTRDVERRLDLIKWLTEWDGGVGEDMIDRLAPYLKDHSEDVRYFAAVGLQRLALPEKVAPFLIDALTNPEEDAGRFKRRLAELLAESKSPLGDAAEKVKAALAGVATQGFSVKDGVIVEGKR
jgi:hypothetical protein